MKAGSINVGWKTASRPGGTVLSRPCLILQLLSGFSLRLRDFASSVYVLASSARMAPIVAL
jgi:hypothetical protein